jgi:hypothetical protein
MDSRKKWRVKLFNSSVLWNIGNEKRADATANVCALDTGVRTIGSNPREARYTAKCFLRMRIAGRNPTGGKAILNTTAREEGPQVLPK